MRGPQEALRSRAGKVFLERARQQRFPTLSQLLDFVAVAQIAKSLQLCLTL